MYKKMSLSKLVSLLSWAYSQEQTRTVCAYIDYLVDCIRGHPDSVIQRRLIQYVQIHYMQDYYESLRNTQAELCYAY